MDNAFKELTIIIVLFEEKKDLLFSCLKNIKNFKIIIIDNAGNSKLKIEVESNSNDKLYDQAVALVAREQKASTSFVQRHLQIGYNRAARIIEQMEKQGVVSTANHVGRREVLVADHSGE